VGAEKVKDLLITVGLAGSRFRDLGEEGAARWRPLDAHRGATVTCRPKEVVTWVCSSVCECRAPRAIALAGVGQDDELPHPGIGLPAFAMPPVRERAITFATPAHSMRFASWGIK
jgi:hypothetical protein